MKQRNILQEPKAITLIALIITIIVMLILAGVTISLTLGENGIFKTAQYAGEQHEEAQIKEEIEMAILEIQTEEVIKGNDLTLQTLVQQLPTKLDIIAELGNNEIIGEYKRYNYVIDSNFKVTIEGRVTGITIRHTLSTEEYTNEDIIITITATSTNGEITNIQAPEGLTKNDDGTYTATANGEYEFTVTDAIGESRTKTIKIGTIDKEVPATVNVNIDESTITTSGFTIKVDAVDNESGIKRYEYFINDTKYDSIESSYTINTLQTDTEYNVYVIAYDKAENATKSSSVVTKTLDQEIEYMGVTVNKVIYIDSVNGNDTNGTGTQTSPYKSLSKITETGIIVNDKTYAIQLLDGTYELDQNIYLLNCNEAINIFGNKQKTILNVGKIFGTASSGGSTTYNVNFYRLMWKDTPEERTNVLSLNTGMKLYNIYFDVQKSNNFAYFSVLNPLEIVNCSLPCAPNSFLRKNTTTIHLTNCYGGYSSGYQTADSDWDYQTNYITTTPQVDTTTYRITDNESVWKNVGTGTDPDGSQADLGVYGGEYSWEN